MGFWVVLCSVVVISSVELVGATTVMSERDLAGSIRRGEWFWHQVPGVDIFIF